MNSCTAHGASSRANTNVPRLRSGSVVPHAGAPQRAPPGAQVRQASATGYRPARERDAKASRPVRMDQLLSQLRSSFGGADLPARSVVKGFGR